MSRQNCFDAIVVGAGPAGSTAAYLLASRGLSVLILDKREFPRDKLCGGLLTWKTVRLAESIFKIPLDVLKSEGIISYRSFKYRVNSSTGDSITGRLDFPFHFVERSTYDSFWLKRAQGAGAVFNPSEKVAMDLSGAQITTSSGQKYHGKFIFGADGVFSQVRATLMKKGLVPNEWKEGLATALEVFVPGHQAHRLADFPVIEFGRISWGYAWCFPRDNGRVLGICGLNAKSGKYLRDGLSHFLESLDIAENHISPPQSHALPYGNYLTKPGYRNVLLLGDACGLADPLVGEGIYYAHKSAQLAVIAALEAYQRPEAAIERYTKYLNQTIIRKLKVVKIARQFVYSFPKLWYYSILSFFLRGMRKRCEEMIQGQRSFRCFTPRNHIRSF